jgi:hypothetical protein
MLRHPATSAQLTTVHAGGAAYLAVAVRVLVAELFERARRAGPPRAGGGATRSTGAAS